MHINAVLKISKKQVSPVIWLFLGGSGRVLSSPTVFLFQIEKVFILIFTRQAAHSAALLVVLI